MGPPKLETKACLSTSMTSPTKLDPGELILVLSVHSW